MAVQRVLIMGAAGRDFHNFNLLFRNRPEFEVVAFTAAQIPNIEGRTYPPELAGKGYPDGIPIVPEEQLERVSHKYGVDRVVFSYSDLSHVEVMHRASRVLAVGADFWLAGPKSTQLKSTRPVVSVCAVRTGAGKSPTSRRVARALRNLGLSVAPVRHPMPYGDLRCQAVQRFSSFEDLDRHHCTIEEREEYEPLLEETGLVYAGIDYEEILRRAEQEADVILWDGGNNDFSFFVPDVQIVVADAHRPGHELEFHPGETNARLADIILINKVDTAPKDNVAAIRTNLGALNPRAAIVEAACVIRVDGPVNLTGRRVLVVEDGPTITHGGMRHGAAFLAAQRHHAVVVDPRPFAIGSLGDIFRQHAHIGPVLPALGYGPEMIRELEATINAARVDVVLAGTPIDLSRFLKINKPVLRVRYEVEEIGVPTLEELLARRFG